MDITHSKECAEAEWGADLWRPISSIRNLLIVIIYNGAGRVDDLPFASEKTPPTEVPMSFDIPNPLRIEHDHLHDDLKRAVAKGGRTGEAARGVATRLHPHFVAEEEFAMPPLGLLSTLAQGKDGHSVSPDDTERAVMMADRLASQMPRMLAEHQEIVSALRYLIAAAQEEGHEDVVEFAERLMLHAQTEEEVLYPAAILVGRYLQLMALGGAEQKRL